MCCRGFVTTLTAALRRGYWRWHFQPPMWWSWWIGGAKTDRQQSSIIPLYDVHQKGLFWFIPCKEAENSLWIFLADPISNLKQIFPFQATPQIHCQLGEQRSEKGIRVSQIPVPPPGSSSPRCCVTTWIMSAALDISTLPLWFPLSL